MGSILFFGSTKQAREEKVGYTLGILEMEEHENNPDLLIVKPLEKKKSIGIAQVRETTKFLNEKPFSHKDKVVVINKAELLTVQAQNALLKTLEEPPSYATIIVNAKTEDSLLETVVSRCKKIRVSIDKREEFSGPNVEEILKMSIGARLAWAAEYSKEDREVVVETLEHWINQLRKKLNITNATNIEALLTIKKDLENTNVSIKLALENLGLKLKARS